MAKINNEQQNQNKLTFQICNFKRICSILANCDFSQSVKSIKKNYTVQDS